MNELVSIITPAYNCKRYFKDTFDSVISQTYEDFEWIIVDDCSNDGSYDYISNLIKNDRRIKILKNNKNMGSAYTRNVGLNNAKGRYITFLDSDDMLDSNYLENQLLFMKDNGPLISSGYRRKALHTCTDFFVPTAVDYKLDLKGNSLSCLTTMYDKAFIGDVRFPENIKKIEDYVFWLNILKRGVVAKGNPKVLATYVIHSGSKSRKKLKLIIAMFTVYHKTQKINFFKSWYYVFRWALYGKKKYKNVR